ncbi:MAG: O-methyltransferase [Thermoprotei archaeon]|nr:O-methyltransferase [Thermoprotei archaeon]
MTYITQLISFHEEDHLLSILIELEKEEAYLPTIGPMKAAFLFTIVTITRPKRILELGTLHGYSALVMLKACKDAGIRPELTTVEMSEVRARRAIANFKRAGVCDIVRVVIDDALTYVRSIKGETFDFIFIDISKGEYPEAFELCLPILKKHGVMVFDNALMPGVRRFSRAVLNDTRVTSSLIKIGDGMLVCIKR